MTTGQQIGVAATTMFGALLSLFGSGCIVWNICRKQKYKRDPYHRLLLGTCFLDLISSLGWFMAPIAPPESSSPRALSVGDTASCTAQGYFIQVGIGFMVYNACLSIYYLMTIRYNVPKERLVWKEAIMHGVSLIWGLGVAIVPIPMQLYNELGVGSGCWIGQFPQYCETEQNPVPCTRGANIDPTIVGYAIAGLPAIASFLVVITCNVLIYLTVRKSQATTTRYSIGVVNDRQKKRTEAIASQATCYVVVFVNSMFWQLLLRNLDGFDIITFENESSFTALIVLAQFCSAFTGFGFLLVYTRPRYLRYRARNLPRLHALATSLSFRKAPLRAGEGRRVNSMQASTGDADGFSARRRSDSIDY